MLILMYDLSTSYYYIDMGKVYYSSRNVTSPTSY